jgi:hypothetical protein
MPKRYFYCLTLGAHVTDGAKILLHQSPTNAVKSGVTRPPAVKPTDEPFEILAMPNVQLTHTHNNAKIFVPHNTLQIYQIAHVILTVPTVAGNLDRQFEMRNFES